MNLLPKSYSQFKDKLYWDSFFKNLKHQDAFQWYGSFQNYRQNIFIILMQLSQLNNKSKSFTSANLGCGNSTLAYDIVTAYPAFAIKIDSYDYSEEVIADMANKNINKEKLTYSVCDMLKPIKEELINHYDIVIDKGTLDAILPQDKPENIKEIQETYFNNIKQMLKKHTHSSYIVISMLQSFILQTLLNSFADDKYFSIKIYERFIPNSEVQPFLIQIRRSPTALQQSKIQILLLNKTVINPSSIQHTIEQVIQLQKFNSYTKNIKQLRPKQLSKFNIFTQNNQTLRFMIEISDHHDPNILKKNNCSVFIVPQGMENLPIFSTENGVNDLQNQIGTSRLIVVKLVIGQKYKDIQSIKNELNPIIPNIIQKNCIVKEVPYLTDGSIGQRHYLFEDQELFIQQILIQDQAHRRLILKNNISLVQSQFKLEYVSEKNNPHLKELQTNVIPHKKGLLVGIDHNHLDVGYSRFIVSAINRFNSKDWPKINILHLGGGACAIPQYLYHKLQNTSHTIVQLSKSVVKNCWKYFQWPEDTNRFNVINAEGCQFIQELQKNNRKFEVIILDVSNDTQKDTHYPPLQFLQASTLKKLKNIVSPNGLLLINTLKQNSQSKDVGFDYPLVFKSNLQSENEIIVCVNRQFPHTIENNKKIFSIDANPLLDTSNWQQDNLSALILTYPFQSSYKLAEADKKKKKKKK